MVLTPSNMMPLETVAPEFTLHDTVSGKEKCLTELKSANATVIMFICNHCPYVKHVQAELPRLANDYQSKGIAFIAINSNDIEAYPEDSPKEMKRIANELGYPFPYLYDESQDVARAYQATCTPDFFLFDEHLLCRYRGQIDDSRPGNKIPVNGKDIRKALDQILHGKRPDTAQIPSTGCNIKWKGTYSVQ